jgi:hypothetical protein
VDILVADMVEEDSKLVEGIIVLEMVKEVVEKE